MFLLWKARNSKYCVSFSPDRLLSLLFRCPISVEYSHPWKVRSRVREKEMVKSFGKKIAFRFLVTSARRSTVWSCSVIFVLACEEFCFYITHRIFHRRDLRLWANSLTTGEISSPWIFQVRFGICILDSLDSFSVLPWWEINLFAVIDRTFIFFSPKSSKRTASTIIWK
jgi:hypothetical protein